MLTACADNRRISIGRASGFRRFAGAVAFILVAFGFSFPAMAGESLAVSTTTVTGSPNPSAPGQLVTFIVTVAGIIDRGAPTGSVTLRDGNVHDLVAVDRQPHHHRLLWGLG